MTEHIVAAAEDLSPGESIGVTIDNVEIAVFNIDGTYYAVQNRCPHKQGPLCEGTVNEEEKSVYCPWHWYEFDLTSGEFHVDPREKLRTFDVERRGGEIVVDL